jgi:hypothetical protein
VDLKSFNIKIPKKPVQLVSNNRIGEISKISKEFIPERRIKKFLPGAKWKQRNNSQPFYKIQKPSFEFEADHHNGCLLPCRLGIQRQKQRLLFTMTTKKNGFAQQSAFCERKRRKNEF